MTTKSPASGRIQPAPRAALTIVATAGSLLLTACGGGVADDMSQAIVCSFANCKDSAALRVEDISPHYTVTQTEGSVRVEARLGQSANLLTTVRPSGGDHLSANTGSQSVELAATDGQGMSYAALLSDRSEQPSVSVDFHRGNDVYRSTVTLPKPFVMLSPAADANLARSSGALQVRFDLPGTAPLGASMAMHCQRTDGSSFDDRYAVPFSIDAPAPGGTTYRINTLDLELTLNERSRAANAANPNTAAVQRCELDIVWTHSQAGQLALALSRHGSITAQRSVRHRVVYDAGL